MKKFILSILFVLLWTTIANAEVYFRGAATMSPEQDVNVVGSGLNLNFDIQPTYGGLVEVGVYSKEKLLSFGIQGTFEDLRAFNPIAGVESLDAQLYSLMANMCTHVQNKSTLTPYVCGSAGMYWLDPSVKLPGGAIVSLDSASAAGYGVEGGIHWAATKDFSLFGGMYWRDTFNPFVVGAGVPGTGVEVDVGRYGFLAGVHF